MLLGGLKIQIASTLALLLTCAILLEHIVVVAFWQQGMVRSEIQHIRSILGMLSVEYSNSVDQEKLSAQIEPELVCGYIGTHCSGVVFADGRHWLQNDSSFLLIKTGKIARQAAIFQKEIIQFEENPWSVLLFKKRYLFVAEPLSADGGEELQAAVAVIVLDSIYVSLFENHQAVFVYWLVNVLLLTVIGFFRLIAITVRPIEKMIRTSSSYHDSDMLFFNGKERRNEVGKLSMALSGMFHRIDSGREKLRQTIVSLEAANSELLQTQKEMIRTEKIASVGRLSAGLAHEIGNPIGIVQGYIELMQQPDLSVSEIKQFGDRAQGELDRVNKLIRQLLDYAGSSAQEMSVVSVDQLFEDISQFTAFRNFHPPVEILREIEKDCLIKCDGESLRQVFLNCLLNALDAVESTKDLSGGRVRITAQQTAKEGGDQAFLHVCIEDNGIGIEKHHLEVIFDPFFTTKDPGRGTGLGLFVSHSIIDAHGGTMWIDSVFGQGATVHIKLPLYLEGIDDEMETADC